MPPGGSGYHLSLIPYIIINLIDLGSFWIHDSCRYPYKTSTQLKYLRSRLSTEANVCTSTLTRLIIALLQLIA